MKRKPPHNCPTHADRAYCTRAGCDGSGERDGNLRATRPAPGTEVSEEFIAGMRDRMAMSYHKYGAIRDAYPHKVNALASLQARLDKYAETGNTEWLIDVANFAMIEFKHPAHPRAHYRPTDNEPGNPGRAAYDTGFEGTQKANKDLSDAEWQELKKGRKA